MPIIRPLTEAEFATWEAQSVPAYAADKVASGAWAEATALEQSGQEHAALLPAGQHTPGHHFYAILGAAGAQVGMIWFAEQDRGASRVAYIYDVEVWPEQQRQGHAGRAFVAIEDEARRLGLAGVALHVFGHNRAAQALYEKLGYRTTNITMYKPVGDAT